HFLINSCLNQSGILLQGGTEKIFPREEQDDELRDRIKLIPVGLHTQCLQVTSNLSSMFSQPFQSLLLSLCFLCIQIGLERRFRIDDDALLTWKTNQKVRPQASRLGRNTFLLEEITVFQHPRHLDYPLELNFPPSSPHHRGSQGADEIRGFRTELIL